MKIHSTFGCTDCDHVIDGVYLKGVHQASALIRYNLPEPYQNLNSRIAQVPLVPPSWISEDTERRNQYG
jgi:hypothetical protein